MAYDVTVFGTLRFPRGGVQSWRRLAVDSRAFRSTSRIFPDRLHLPAVIVDELLHELPMISGHGLFRFDGAEDGELNVRGRFTQAAFEARARQLASLFLVAAQTGAEGDICFLGEGVFVGYGVSVGSGRGTLVTLSTEEVQNASMHPDLDVISGYFSFDETPASLPRAQPDPPRPGLVAPRNPKRSL